MLQHLDKLRAGRASLPLSQGNAGALHPAFPPLPLTFLASSMRMSCMEIWAKGGRS